jgi:excisionase family DNA binding protein
MLTTVQVAKSLNVHWRTLHRLRQRGEGPPAYRIGRVYRYQRADVDAWLREQASPETKETST